MASPMNDGIKPIDIWEYCRGNSLNFPYHGNMTEQTTLDEGYVFPAGTSYKAFEGNDFGYIIIPEGTKDINGVVVERRLFKY